MSFDNDVTIEIYEGTTRVQDISNDLEFAENVQFTTHIPGGDYGDAAFFIERDVTAPILFEIGHRVLMFNEQDVAYEGFISGVSRIVDTDYQGIEFLCVGPTDWYLMKYPLEKRWADTRIGEDVWQDINLAQRDKFDIDRSNRLMFIPKGVAFANGNVTGLRYYMPTGQTIKRVTFNYDLTTSAAATNWMMNLYDPVGVATLWSVNRTTAGQTTGSVDHTLVTPRNYLNIGFTSEASQTPVEDGTVYGKFTSIVVYSETDNPITMTTITQDCAAEVAAAGYLSSSTALIGTPGTQLTLEPFITNGYPGVADILNDAVGRGDGLYNRWIWGMRNSDAVPGSGGKPVLYLEQYPATTDWEYEVTFGDENIASGIELLQDGLAIANHIITSRTDASGRFVYQTPAVDANLADATSKTDYRVLAGVRLDAGDCEQVEATAYAQRFKATYKDPPFKLMRPLTLVDYVRRKDGSEQPVRLIRPGERIKMMNFISTLSGIEPVFVITSVAHSIADELVSLTAGIPGAPIGARQVLRPVSAPPDNATGGSSTPAGGTGTGTGTGSGSNMNFNWYERYGKVSGLKGEAARAAWLAMPQNERNKFKLGPWKAWKKAKEKSRKKKG